MKKNIITLALLIICVAAEAQQMQTPDMVYGKLFTDVQMSRIFPDNKTFVDCIPKRNPKDIVADYLAATSNPAIKFSLKLFVDENFVVPAPPTEGFKTEANEEVKAHITRLWDALQRNADKPVAGSSLLPLPGAYIVPGGRFREIYYWDSYFTMLGLQESNRYDLMEDMINNFAALITTYGHIPNGNRSYYLSRSQPPFFAMMLQLLEEKKGTVVYALYKNALQKEYAYWMDKTSKTKHVVKMPDGSILNRYYDQDIRPRQESFYEDSLLGIKSANRKLLYKNLRTCAETGWDFSTRWFADGKSMASIQTTNLIPVDLNCLLYQLELTLGKASKETGNLVEMNYYNQLAAKRKTAINKYCYNKTQHWYYDYNITTKSLSKEKTIAGIQPLFFNVAPAANATAMVAVLQNDFVKAGGVVTTLKNSGQQWDAPNGWAPLEYMAIKGLDNYGFTTEAKDIAQRWVGLNVKVFKSTGKLMEKYNVTDTHLDAGGGEYPSQDGFGWTNGVLLKLMATYNIKE
ncbi:alpha,alpha-trehalase TreF [Limnovirga soli]|uniref:Alpha,alpha-trehalase TreF n=1 Tax=Limnovirga soli TaxID=2656915 RepID=A0A8J8JW05_9BACT|nr:alpha,alpha-trehalase TreF [Limnovirga soli]NNV57920.1 alpha,alpha-trehalase TreF [Limnovirga soli]